MRVYAIPASYLPEVETTLRDLVRRVGLDMALRAEPPDVSLSSVIPDAMRDEDRDGMLLITIGEMPQDAHLSPFLDRIAVPAA